MNSYDLSRNWFDWCFENPEKINPNHTAMYFFIIEHCNRLGWKEKFGLPATMVKDAIGIKSYNTYKKTLDDLIEWGFVVLIQKSLNQYSSNIIALSKKAKAHTKALDKALVKHTSKQSESTRQSIDSIDKQINQETNLPINKETIVPPSKIELFENDEVVDFVNKHFGKNFTPNNFTRFQKDIMNNLITVNGYSKEQVVQAWCNIGLDPFHNQKGFNTVTFSYLSEPKTIERYLFWKKEETKQADQSQVFTTKGLKLD